MKPSNIKFAILAAILMLALPSCTETAPQSAPAPRYDIPMSRSESAIVNTQNSFSLKVLRELIDETESNFCASPLSLSMSLSMLSNGAAGDSQKEILDVLGFTASEMDEVNRFNQRICSELGAVDKSTSLSLANSIWIDNGMDVKDQFITDTKGAYGAEVFCVNLAEATEEINSWSSTKTNGRIPQFLTGPIKKNQIALLNALYFKGIWHTPFDKKNTEPGNFFNFGKTIVQTDMMETEIMCKGAYDTEGANWISIAYGNGAFHAIIIMPDYPTKQTADEYFANLSDEDFNEMLNGLVETKFKLKMPKFEISSDIDMAKLTDKMGLTALTDGDFTRISDYPFSFQISQKSTISFDEQGSEAASVTKVSGELISPAPLQVNKGRLTIELPFVFLIREVSTGSILFVGRINEL